MRAAILFLALSALGCGKAAVQAGAASAGDPADAEGTAKTATRAEKVELIKGALPSLESKAGASEADVVRLEQEFGQQQKKAQKSSVSRNRRMFGVFVPSGPRPQVKPEPFEVSALSKGNIPDGLAPEDAPVDELPNMATNEAKDLFVDWQSAYRQGKFASLFSMREAAPAYTTVRISLQGYAMARLRIGHNEGTVTKSGGGGVYATCQVPLESFRRIVPARWETLRVLPTGQVSLRVTDAWFDSHSCKASVVRKTEVPLTSLSGGLFLAYREACKDCAGGERLVLLTASALNVSASAVGGEAVTQVGAMTKVVLPLRRGGGGSVVVRHSGTVVTEWFQAIGRTEEMIPADVIAGVDVMQGVSEDEPVAIAYRTAEATNAEGLPIPSFPVPIPQVAPSPDPLGL